jgi:hypothetical protein
MAYLKAGFPLVPCIGKRPMAAWKSGPSDLAKIKHFARTNPGKQLNLALILGHKPVVVLQDKYDDENMSPDFLPQTTPPAPTWTQHGSRFWLFKYHKFLDEYEKARLSFGDCCIHIRNCCVLLPLDAEALLLQIDKGRGIPSLPDSFVDCWLTEDDYIGDGDFEEDDDE